MRLAYRTTTPHRLARRIPRAALFTLLQLLWMVMVLPWQAARAQTDGWTQAAPDVPGIDYRAFYNVPGTSGDPIHVARMDRSLTNLTLESLIASGYIQVANNLYDLWTGDGIQPMVRRFDQSINYWGDLGSGGEAYWGKRSQIVVAINGDLSDTSTYIPAQGQLQSGWYPWRFVDSHNRSGFAWKVNREAFIGNCTSQPSTEQKLITDLAVVDPDNYSKNIQGINVIRTTNKIYMFTPHYGLYPDRTRPAELANVEVVVQLGKPVGIGTPVGNISSPDQLPADLVIGTVVDKIILDPTGEFGPTNPPPTKILFDQVVFSGYGDAAGMLNRLKVGQQVGINLTVNDLYPIPGSGCSGSTGLDWAGTYTAIGVDATLIANRSIVNYDNSSVAPRTAIAYNDQYLYFVVAEGHPITYVNGRGVLVYDTDNPRTGISLSNLASFIHNSLGADWAVNLDGGGSSQMIVNGVNVVKSTDFLYCPQQYLGNVYNPPGNSSNNTPSVNQTNPTREQTIVGLVEKPQTADNPEVEHTLSPDYEVAVTYYRGAGTGNCQRRVPNGIAMVSVQPKIVSQLFTSGEAFEVVPNANLKVRQGPGNNYRPFVVFPYQPSTYGVVIADANQLNGVFATGTYWWFVEINGVRGWVDENQIMHLSPP
jgi:hypothetical protein